VVSSEDASRLILNIYLDGTGKALVTGYAENPERLAFLNSSQYSYENETRQLYALTNALTRKDGEIWTILFESLGYYEDYRVTFYLPSDFTVKNVNSSRGLEHLFSASNDSLALDFQGYDILDPVASIEYQQPLDVSAPPPPRPSYLLPLSLMLILAVGTAAAFWWRYKVRPSQGPAPFEEDAERDSFENERVEEEAEAQEKGDEVVEADAEDAATEAEIPPINSPAEKIEISSEMAAVMETLTPRERAVLQALIDRGGRSTQADLRYETRTPKSSLTGIIYSLERRKLITKKEWGRTNVIELSEWFLSKKGRS